MRTFFILLLALLSGCGLFPRPKTTTKVGDLKEAKLEAAPEYEVGTGIYDITGSAYGKNMWGYVKVNQSTNGIHTRQRARAFVAKHINSGTRMAFVITDLGSVPQAVHTEVVRRLKRIYGGLYTEKNIIISATHTHSAPLGISHSKLYNYIVLGYSPKYFEVAVSGIVESISNAHANLAPGHITYADGILQEGNSNRQPNAYAQNPNKEKSKYNDTTDKVMNLIKFTRADGSPIGVFNWYPVHGTSMEADNRLISADNKGGAAQLFEKQMGTNYFAKNTFVAGFANANGGDATPNTAGTVDDDTDWDCIENENFKCTQKSASLQYNKAKDLFATAKQTVSGPISFQQVYKDFSNVQVVPRFSGTSRTERTCPAAVGMSKTAGATADGPGPLWDGQHCENMNKYLAYFMCSSDVDPCQGVKPLLLSLGTKKPAWTPQIIPLQLVRLGQILFVTMPGEATTMSGRRLKEQLLAQLKPTGIRQIIIAGYSNAYAGYITTREEYQTQHYEGASTHFGEYTLAAYQQEYSMLADHMIKGTNAISRVSPPDLRESYTTKFKAPENNKRYWTKNFGTIVDELPESFVTGETVSAEFVSANPANNYLTQSSFLEIQKKEGSKWRPVAYDWDWSTKFMYKKSFMGYGTATIEWNIPTDTPQGKYRILHRGYAKKKRVKELVKFEGYSNTFIVN